ncbi:GlsB/YeaQ/YmgE family stress response membrane protein [Arcticibacterium luteifluviistationis]|uniref:GlsB/YeaQ/YmgE family stress response membrane protein n=1 Tax=Arcticibacterium luteifluviistationis TaxID=1784714 RepID=A0A2Z4G6F6_9BACT|nr:GlsB/YeaQ/YmgE family stress response membrane protein [Arcticibacterium luteifluviistationis]AWV96680.1 GlsB/YeaQ/YmgE family stress response membrane protein [Arcticibacterium luteifluviistationis]
MEFIWFLLIGAVSGWLAGQVWKGAGFGLIGNIVVGILGSIVGGWLAGNLGIGGEGLLGRILISAGGAWLLLFIISLVKKA